jgi:hypothetical protein
MQRNHKHDDDEREPAPAAYPPGETDLRFVSVITKNTYGLILAGTQQLSEELTVGAPGPPALRRQFHIIDFPLSNCVNSGIRRTASPRSTSPTA